LNSETITGLADPEPVKAMLKACERLENKTQNESNR